MLYEKKKKEKLICRVILDPIAEDRYIFLGIERD